MRGGWVNGVQAALGIAQLLVNKYGWGGGGVFFNRAQAALGTSQPLVGTSTARLQDQYQHASHKGSKSSKPFCASCVVHSALAPLEWLGCMGHTHGFTEIARSALLGLCMTMIGSFRAHSVCVEFVSATLLMGAPSVVTLTVIVALEIMYAIEMHC
jgi:hypothetical protein